MAIPVKTNIARTKSIAKAMSIAKRAPSVGNVRRYSNTDYVNADLTNEKH